MKGSLVKDLRIAEMAREGDMLLIGDALVGKHHDQMLRPGIGDLLHCCRIERPAHSTPWISAPRAGCRALTVIVMMPCSANVFSDLLQR